MLKIFCTGVLLLYEMPVFIHPVFGLNGNGLAQGDKKSYTLDISSIDSYFDLRSSLDVYKGQPQEHLVIDF